jgi:hypothetical protein
VMLRLMFTWLCWMILLPLMIDDAVLLDAQWWSCFIIGIWRWYEYCWW